MTSWWKRMWFVQRLSIVIATITLISSVCVSVWGFTYWVFAAIAIVVAVFAVVLNWRRRSEDRRDVDKP